MRKRILFLFAACILVIASYAQAPIITSFAPASGPVGTLVTITGTHFSSPTSFTIGGVSAIVVSDNGGTLVGMVMPGAATGSVSITTSGGATSGSSNYVVTPTHYPHTQQGPKLVGTGVQGFASQGTVSISADGNTAIVGGSYDNSDTGALWVFTRSAGIWTQQGNKLVGTGVIGHSYQGHSVSLSADGNTAIVGAPGDNNTTGAAWVFTRSGGMWAQQGSKLVGAGAVGGANQGGSVSISADGNTAIVSGGTDNYGTGAAWIFTRSGNVWTQQGNKLVGTGGIGVTGQGWSVSISADGNTAMVGGPSDSNGLGASWIYARSGSVWTQQGPKLVGTGAIGMAKQGWSVALSADGNTAIEGGGNDSSFTYSGGMSIDRGAVWIFTRSGNVWTQQGSKLVGTGAVGPMYSSIQQGYSVSLSADGNVAIEGGNQDSFSVGAAWVFTRSGSIWTQQGTKLVGTGAVGNSFQGNNVALSADGRTAMVGGVYDNNGIGAAWVYVAASCSPDSSVMYDTICSSALPYIWNGMTITQAGQQSVQLMNSSGCDSVATLMLVVKPSRYDTLSQSICDGDSFMFSGLPYYSSGYYSQIHTGVSGCDSIATLHLTVHAAPVVTWTQADTLQCKGASGEYLPVYLYSETPAGGIFSGPHVYGDTLIADIYGNYSVTYTYTDNNGCSSSVVKHFHFSICDGLPGMKVTNPARLYPDPNNGSFTLETTELHGKTYIISDMHGDIIRQGKILTDKQIIDIDAVPGLYILSIPGCSEVFKFAVLK